jgi:hypothetical protein
MRIFDLHITADRTALPCTLLLWMGLSLAASLLFRLSLVDALMAGLTATLVHWFSALWHDAGHVIGARMTGHPMQGLKLWTVFAINQYPADEGDLPAKVHVRRALSGPIASLVLTCVFAVLLFLAPQTTALWWLVLFGFLLNALVMTSQVMLPLGFNDGATLRAWLPALRTAQKPIPSRTTRGE